MNVSHSIQHVKFENIGPFITHISNEILESNWRELFTSIKSDLKIHISNIVKSVLDPIFDEIAITEITYEQTELEMNRLIESAQRISSNRSTNSTQSSNSRSSRISSSSSSSVVQKLPFILLVCSLLLSTRNMQYS